MKNLTQKLALALLLVFSIQNSYSQSSYSDHILGGMTCVIVQHSVADFDIWETAYKKDIARREESGIHEKLVLRGEDDPNYVTVVFELSDVKKAQDFFADPHSAKLMQAAGVTTKPNFTYFKVNNSRIPKGSSFLIVRHTVKDYAFWKKAFDKHQNVRLEYNLYLTALGTDLENPLNVVAIFNSADADNIKSFLEKSNLKEAMKDAGITSEPIQEIMVLKKKP
jgi:hypothetical protein